MFKLPGNSPYHHGTLVVFARRYRFKLMGVGFGVTLAALWSCFGTYAASPEIHTEDTALFYKIYDLDNAHPTADHLQHDYIDRGSDGLRRFLTQRGTTAERIAKTIADQSKIYADAKANLSVLPNVRTRVSAALARFALLYPAAKFPPVTIAIGRGRPVAIADETGVMIGLEALRGVTWMTPNIEDRFTYVIAHEYTHVQQALAVPAFYNKQNPTVLEVSLIEGAAEFMGEMTSGSVSSSWFADMTGERAKATESAFVADEDKTDLSAWLYNGTMDRPGDLGYWVGYCIVKSYYEHAADKDGAIRNIIEMNDAHAFLAKSGWHPGLIQIESTEVPRRSGGTGVAGRNHIPSPPA